jgi:hypothetical protein
MGYIYASSLASINVELVKLNCPYPLNGATANVKLEGTQPLVYNITNDDDSATYHVTTFECGDANISSNGTRVGEPTPQVSKTTYTTSSSWFNLPNVGAYLFYIQESIEQFFIKVLALGTLVVLFVNAPAEVLAIPQYTYVNAILIAFMGLGGFMVVRG